MEMLDGAQAVVSEVVRADRGFVGSKQKKLLVLDVNGLLIHIFSRWSYIPPGPPEDDIIMDKLVFRRPHCDDFLNFCFEKFNVGFWTSRTKENMEPLLDFILGSNRSRLLFCLDQSQCTKTRYYTILNVEKPIFLKKLQKLWDKSEFGLPWERGEYNESNTVLIDDTPHNALLNPPYTAVFPFSYQYRDVNDNSLGPNGDLRVYLEGLAEADNVQEYIMQNPFGQGPITKENPWWSYYCRVIEAYSTSPRQKQSFEFKDGSSAARPYFQHNQSDIEEEIQKKKRKLVVPSEPENLPFVKNNPLWNTIESTPVFQKMPQKPHFQPLANESIREGLAIEHMVTFFRIVNDTTCRLRINGPKSYILDNKELLAQLGKHGFDVKVIDDCLSQLLVVKNTLENLVHDITSIDNQITEHDQEKTRIEREIEEVNKQIMALQEKLKLAEVAKERKDEEIVILLDRQREINDDMNNVESDFSKIVSSIL